MRTRNIAFSLLALVVLGGGAFAAYAWHPAIDPIDPPRRESFDPALVRRGAQLAALGNCNVCHTVPGGQVFAGGLALPTPFGTIYSTNITPDPETGIGRWSEAAFARSMRAGLDRDGSHLYPAFPYNHFTLVSDEDNRALYAYLMTRDPVRAPARENDLPFPLNQRFVLAGWKLLFFREGPYRPAQDQGEEWNRGAYLAEGLGHCGACHTPRNALGAEKRGEHYAGGEAEGWHAYAINAASAAAVPWTTDSMFDYLRRGWHEHHGIARGPMAPVTANMAYVPEEDARAVAAYTVASMGQPSAERQRRAEALLAARGPVGGGARPAASDSQTVPASGGEPGAAIYAGACATCHEAGRPLPFGGINLAFSSGVRGESPENLINVVLNGLPAAEGERAPIMPGFRGVLDDAQLVALLSHLRARFGEAPAWEGLDKAVREARSGDRLASSRPTDSVQAAPADPTQRGTTW